MRKQFRHDLVTDLPILERIHTEAGRFYKTPTGLLYPSVTTVLGSVLPKDGLEDWIARVGAEEAAKIAARSARRGTEVHRLCEDLVLNRAIDLKKEMPINRYMFQQLERKLIDNCDTIRGSELFLYSDKLKIAGACDLVADWNDKLSLIDFKTSRSFKPIEWIDSYFLQTALYAFMLWERTGILCSQLVVLIAVEDAPEALVYIQKTKAWLDRAKKLCQKCELTDLS